MALLSEDDNYAVRFLNELQVDVSELLGDAAKGIGSTQHDAAPEPSAPKKQKKNTKTDTIDKYGRDLTEEAKKGKIDPVIGRTQEIERVIQILCRRTKNNPCLIGEPGVGKTAIIEGLALRISEGDVPDILENKRIISLDLTCMVAGTKYRGDFEERIKAIIDEVTQNDDIILFI